MYLDYQPVNLSSLQVAHTRQESGAELKALFGDVPPYVARSRVLLLVGARHQAVRQQADSIPTLKKKNPSLPKQNPPSETTFRSNSTSLDPPTSSTPRLIPPHDHHLNSFQLSPHYPAPESHWHYIVPVPCLLLQACLFAYIVTQSRLTDQL
jgi:hypothetical protein